MVVGAAKPRTLSEWREDTWAQAVVGTAGRTWLERGGDTWVWMVLEKNEAF